MKQERDKPEGSLLDKTDDELLELRRKRGEERGRRAKKRRRLMIAIAGAAALIFILLNWDKLAPASVADSVQGLFSSFSSEKFPVSLSSGSFKGAAAIGSNIGVVTDTSMLIYSRSGVQLASRPHSLSNPQLQGQGGKAVLYDRGGKTLKVETRFDEPFSLTADYPIISASMGKSGALAVVTESGSYLGEMTVYDEAFKKVFHWFSAQGRIFCASLSPDGRHVAAVTVSASGGGYRSTVYVFSTGSQKPLSATNIDGTLLFSVQYINSDRIAAVGDNQAVFLSPDGKKKTAYAYGGTPQAYVNENGATALAFSSYVPGSVSQVVSLSPDGKVLAQPRLPAEVISLSAGGGRLCALMKKSVWCARYDGGGAKTVALTGDETAALPLKGDLYLFGLQAIAKAAVS